MPKTIRKVQEIVIKSRGSGYAKNAPYEIERFDGGLRLLHYGILILKLENNKITKLGGFSQSDANAISTVLDMLGYNIYVSKAKSIKPGKYKKIDGWYIIPIKG